MIKKKRYLLLAILWMMFIFYLSHQPADISSSQSGGVINLLSNLPVIGGVIEYMMEIDIAEFVIRKSAHMFAYFVLAILWFMSMYENKINLRNISTVSFVMTFLFACSDEYHQTFVNGRSGEFRDVLVDSTGAIIGLVLACLIVRYINKKKS